LWQKEGQRSVLEVSQFEIAHQTGTGLELGLLYCFGRRRFWWAALVNSLLDQNLQVLQEAS